MVDCAITIWKVSEKCSVSDHKMIFFQVAKSGARQKSYSNPRKIDKSRTSELKQDSRGLTSTNDVERAVNAVTSILRSSYQKSCPITYPGSRKGLSSSLQTLATQNTISTEEIGIFFRTKAIFYQEGSAPSSVSFSCLYTLLL